MTVKEQLQTFGKAVITCQGISKTFGDRIILESVSFRLVGGQSLCVCGKNASGKTTLLKIIAGLLSANEGLVEIGGLNIHKL